MAPEHTSNDLIEIEISDATVRPLIDGYLGRRRDDLVRLQEALAAGDFETLRLAGHNMHGSGGAYGLDRISDIGAAVEEAAGAQDAAAVDCALADLSGFLTRVRIV